MTTDVQFYELERKLLRIARRVIPRRREGMMVETPAGRLRPIKNLEMHAMCRFGPQVSAEIAYRTLSVLGEGDERPLARVRIRRNAKL